MKPIAIGDFVTGHSAGYWQVIGIKPKRAPFDGFGATSGWKEDGKVKKGDFLYSGWELKPRR